MTGREPKHVVPVLVALVAVLLPAAVLAVTTGDRRAPVRVEALRPAGFGMANLQEEGATVTSSTPATGPASTLAAGAPTLPVTTTVVRPGPVTTAHSVTPQPTTPPLPSTTPPAGPTTTVMTVARTSSWSASQNGIGLGMRMEPVAPQAGEPVTFFLELSPIEGCCIGGLSFGDETGAPLAFGGARCTNGAGTVQKTASTHTYAAAGAYKVVASAATVPCSDPSPAGDGSLVVRGFPVGVSIEACVVIGPPQAGCTP